MYVRLIGWYLDLSTGRLKEVEDIDSEAASILEVAFEKSPRKGGEIVVLLKVPQRHQSAVELARILGMHNEGMKLESGFEIRSDEDIQNEAEKLARLITTLKERKQKEDAAKDCLEK